MARSDHSLNLNYPFLKGGGEMGELTRSYNWAKTSVGPPAQWPQSLKTILSVLLNSKFPMFLWWGPELICFYNDAYRPSLGQNGKHPVILGMPAAEAWPEIWEIIKPLIDQVMNGGEATWSENQLVPIYRNGKIEDVYWTFSYSPVTDESGNIGGVLVTCTETTDAVKNLQRTQESEERFRTMAEGSDILIAVGDETSNAVYFNKAWVELTGRSMEDLLEFGWVDLVHPDDKERYVNIYLSAFKERVPFTGEFRVLSKAGDYRWLLAKGPPRFHPDGTFAGYISSCLDITERKLAEEERIALLNSIAENQRKLDQILNHIPSPVVVIRGAQQLVETANEACLGFWRKQKDEVIGKSLMEILPELKGQPFPEQLRQVLETGEIIALQESPVMFNAEDGTERYRYVDYIYQPLTDQGGNRTGVLATSFDVTDKVETRWLLENNAEELQAMNEELTSFNEELATVNEELATANEELIETEQSLQWTIDELAESESRFRYLIQEAPVAIGVLTGRELIIESANEMILNIWGKDNTILGLPLAIALPELEGQPFLGLLNGVFTTGKIYYGNETRALLEHRGKLKEFYFNFVYQPIRNEEGATTDIIVVATDVTEQVTARKQVERAEEGLRMAIEAAELGSYSINVKDRIFVSSPRLKEFFGFGPDEEVPFEAAINQIHPDYRQAAADLVEAAITKGMRFDMEYPVVGHRDGKIRWVRGIGTLQQDSDGRDSYFTGVLHEITEKKQDEIRKNDFIGMVSHELKTPLTSLSAYMQLLHIQAKKNGDRNAENSLEKANRQVKKMTTLINGFLDISRLESGKIILEKADFDLVQLVSDQVEETSFMLSGRLINFIPGKPISVHADRDKIGSVISNLLSNAVKYSANGKAVAVKCEIKNEMVCVSVQDEGMGIKKDDLKKLFDRYYRVQDKQTQHIAGFGIGLYLSAEIIHHHQGEIWAESDYGNGSVFYFSLPIAK